MYWKLILDPPHTYAAEQGSVHSRYASDFHDTPAAFTDTWRCPVTNLLMLEPSTKRRDFGSDFHGIGDFRQNVANATFWRKVQRSIDNLEMFSTTRPAGQAKHFDALTLLVELIPNVALAATFDELEWALESLFTLNIDEGFAIHYHGLTDELLRKTHWMYLQWDNIGVHISHTGHVKVAYYPDRGHMEDAPEVVEEFDICESGELLGYSGFFIFLPIPGYGLAMYHSKSPQRQTHITANGNSFAARGAHLIPWQSRRVGSHLRLFETDTIKIALNPYHANIIGFQSLTFQTEGSYLEQNFDPGYRPVSTPDDLRALYTESFSGQFGAVAATLRNNDNSANWAVGDRQGRILFDLTTNDSRYTPFVYGWGAQWLPVFITRDPGSVEITDGYEDVLQRLEMTTDSEGNFEGSCRLKIQTKAAAVKVERGDATYQIEFSEDGAEWTVYAGGIIKFGEPEMMYHPDWGFFWQVDAALHGQEERFEEMWNSLGTAFDGLTLGEAINLALFASGFNSIAEADFPAAFLNLRVPAQKDGTNFRYQPRAGDKMKHIFRMLLFLARTQHNEYRMFYDWDDAAWAIVRRARGEDPAEDWVLTYDDSLEDLANHIAYYDEPLKIIPQPVEATQFQVVGVSESGEKGKAKAYLSTPIMNDSAVQDFEVDGEPNMDYTGRVKSVRVLAPAVESIEQANLIARKINPRFFHRNLLATVMLPAGHFTLDTLFGLTPDTKVYLTLPPYVEETEDRVHILWVKKQTIVIEGEEHGAVAGMAHERMVLQMDETWENSVKGE